MRLKKLELIGFKSFADKIEMTFENGITGVVGPNGSGKSNISDAVRWVLGEQSAKSLRGTKMEDVIFNGTEKRRRLAWCEVSLIFDNEDRKLPIDYSEVCVTRRVYRSGEGEYSINRTPCRLRDIVDLFRDTGIGKEGYSLIGQGRIDEILSGKSEDRRNVFEEAAGIVKFKARKQEAERRLANTNDNLSRVEDILQELQDRMEPLRKQSETARRYLELRDEQKKLDLNIFLSRSERYAVRLKELEEALETVTQALRDAEAEEEKLTQDRDATQETLTALEDETAILREEVQEAIRVAETAQGNVSVLKERLAASEKDRKRLFEEAEAAKKGEGGVREEIETLGIKIEQEEKELTAAQNLLETHKAQLSEKERTLTDSEKQLEDDKAELIRVMNALSDVRNEQTRLETLRETLTERLESAQSETGRDEDDLSRFAQELREAEEAFQKDTQEKQSVSNALRDAERKLREAEEQFRRLEQNARQLSENRQAAASRLKILEEMQRDYEGYQFSVKNVLQEAKRRNDSSIKGVVASLLTVPKELERAIDMVLGASLQNIVVSREEDAKRMIDYLRGNKMGRATFLPISAVRGRTLDSMERKCLSMPGCVGLASELVQFDEQYRGIMENLLGRTVIAENLDAGIAIMRAGHHAFRLVTLEGDVMHSGGSMTGGSVQSRATSLLSREREVAEQRQNLQEIEKRLAQIESAQQKNTAAVEAIRQERGNLSVALRNGELLCARSEARLDGMRSEYAARSKKRETAQEERTQIEALLAETEASLSNVSGSQTEQEDTRDALRTRITQRQSTLPALRREVQELRDTVQTESIACASARRGLDATRNDKTRLENDIRNMKQLLESSERLLREKDEMLVSDREQLALAQQEQTQSQATLDAARKRFSEKDALRMKAQEHIHETGKALDELRARLDEFTDKSTRTQLQKARVEDESAQMTKRIWEDYELTLEGAKPFFDENFKLTESERRVAAIRQEIKSMGSVNVASLDEYREVSARVEELTSQKDDLTRAQLDLQGIIEELLKKMDVQFRTQFEIMDKAFRRTFVRLFGGGQASLRLTDPKDALNCEIEVVAQPPGKKLQLLSLLSGGERALTAIAILMAILESKPTPFCILDEIEAALDDANIDNFAEALREYAEHTQFIIVTHRKGTMQRCDALYGVAMEEKGVSKIMSVKLSE